MLGSTLTTEATQQIKENKKATISSRPDNQTTYSQQEKRRIL